MIYIYIIVGYTVVLVGKYVVRGNFLECPVDSKSR